MRRLERLRRLAWVATQSEGSAVTLSDDGGPSDTPPVLTHDDGVIAIDTLTAGMTDVTAGYLIDAPRPALIECGPALTIGSVLQGLAALGLGPSDLAYLVLTHIHLDHAGGAGDVAAAFPNATVVVSEHGARHLAEPDRLNASSARVYGPLFDTVYGACTPVPAERLRSIADRDELDLGAGRVLELLHTPGHAKHHLGVVDPDIGAVFSGDSVGVQLPGMTELRPATPPPEFHLEAALRSLDRYRERSPGRIYLAHYGPVDPADAVLDQAEEQLRRWVEVAELARDEAHTLGLSGTHELDHVAETLQQRFHVRRQPSAEADDVAEDDARLRMLNDTRANAAGLLRYLHRRDTGELTELG
ncbi:MAG: MBL fold metallo-hydrolase [Nitriliruptor sp.]|nr:MAG: MBL fold metallo-hydrolase [Nitriliruptor sp.]